MVLINFSQYFFIVFLVGMPRQYFFIILTKSLSISEFYIHHLTTNTILTPKKKKRKIEDQFNTVERLTSILTQKS